MKILLVSGKYLPEKKGGIENYTHCLATSLLQHNNVVHAAILESGYKEAYDYEGVKVIPLQEGFAGFQQLVKKEQYDICHFHEYSEFGGIELFWIKKAKEFCNKIFFTFHLPYLTCYKNDFRYKGVEDCSNFSSAERCTKCVIATKLHYSKQKINPWNWVIDIATSILKNQSKSIALKKKIISKHNDLMELLNTCNEVFIIADWFKNILVSNGYGYETLKKIPPVTKITIGHVHEKKNKKNKIVFAGRIEKQKGLHLICEAMNKIKSPGLQLDVFGNIVDEYYFKSCKQLYSFNYKNALPREALLKQLKDYDFLVLPSVFTEMYPMILQESFYERLPVIVSAAKGNLDMVKEGKNGFIFEYDSADDLAKKIDTAYNFLKSGWEPLFANPQPQEKNIQQIVSFYKNLEIQL